ncbi:hypothetical protein ACA910_020623 [Epithemia clementina (nom. ined.)]
MSVGRLLEAASDFTMAKQVDLWDVMLSPPQSVHDRFTLFEPTDAALVHLLGPDGVHTLRHRLGLVLSLVGVCRHVDGFEEFARHAHYRTPPSWPKSWTRPPLMCS